MMKRFGKRFRSEFVVPIGFFFFCIGLGGLVASLNDQIGSLVPAILVGLGVGLMYGGYQNVDVD